MTNKIIWFDTEVTLDGKGILDFGAVSEDNSTYNTKFIGEFSKYIEGVEYLCGHNIIHHDMRYIEKMLGKTINCRCIDTLYLSPLLFPKKPYHSLVKDDKLVSEYLNNPINDSKKAKNLFFDELVTFNSLPENIKNIYFALLSEIKEFSDFFKYIGFKPNVENVSLLIKNTFSQQICKNSELNTFIINYPTELAYALALINTGDYHSVTPPWVIKNNPKIENIIKELRNTPCNDPDCSYCNSMLNAVKGLKKYFGYPSFRTYNGEALQQKAAEAAIAGKSLLAIFPTGGGKSITFQVPALIAGQCTHGLTVVISPLQSLMKDQVDNLINKNSINDAVYINGLLNPIERKEAIEKVENGEATMLYISPEQLRSKTIEKLLMSRNVVRFVIDEAHCFSSWGQDFRVDYLYIGRFIREFQEKKSGNKIAVSCFTATAKQKVITDICDYFKRELNLDLQLFTTTTERKNLHYKVTHAETDEEKYSMLRGLIEAKKCPTIVYVSRTKRTIEIADRLTKDGFPALPFNGQMKTDDKIANQDAFINGKINVMVATSAFGMGVDKSDVKLVIHYDISDSLENYVQEAGRAGRDQSLEAECHVLFNENDLDKHFILLNQTKLSLSEIQQVWKAIRDLTKKRPIISCSPLEIARQAGWNESVKDLETRVKTAISALEDAGFIERGKNIPRVYATSINASSAIEASQIIDNSDVFKNAEEKEISKIIIQKLIASRTRSEAGNDDAESRVDYIADHLGIDKKEVINSINTMREANLLKNESDMEVAIGEKDTLVSTKHILNSFAKLEEFILNLSDIKEADYNLKELNEAARNKGINSNIKNLRILLYFLSVKGYLGRIEDKENQLVRIGFDLKKSILLEKHYRRLDISNYVIEYFYKLAAINKNKKEWAQTIAFSMVKTFNDYKKENSLLIDRKTVNLRDFEEALLYLTKIGALKIEGGFLVIYNGLEIKRLIKENNIKYKAEQYKKLNEYYQMKVQQIHIVGEFANLMVKDYDSALKYVQDYFMMDYKKFIKTYFKGNRAEEIKNNITPEKFKKLFGSLSEKQLEIINDKTTKYMVVAAGPGSGKTMLLVHKLASLMQLEGIKHEQLLMLTFSRAAATEFKMRLMKLVGNAANFVQIKTFHSYSFDLLGLHGDIETSEKIVLSAAKMIEDGKVEANKIAKRVLVIDEAQDMDADEFRLVKALIDFNEEMRVIAVGDDDQNIYEFRGSNSEYMNCLLKESDSKKYEMVVNYRSKANIVSLCNSYAKWFKARMKSTDIQSYTSENGIVKITHYNGQYVMEGLIDNVCSTHKDGYDCVMTQTNDEALQVYSKLIKRGIPARLIQSADSVKLCNVLEIKDFTTKLYNCSDSSIINPKDWEDGKVYLNDKYSGSTTLEILNNLFKKFEALYPNVKYLSDFEEFIHESNYEDFYDNQNRVILVSTMHKAKGKQFDKVYILLNNFVCKSNDEAQKRILYVGMTRAKKELYIHLNTDLFSKCNLPNIEMIENKENYISDNEIALQMEYRDFFLDYSFNVEKFIKQLKSGESLEFTENGLVRNIGGENKIVAKFSKKFKEKLAEYTNKGYKPTNAEIRFIVSWTKTKNINNEVRENDDKNKSTPILLANLYLTRN